MEKKDEEKAGMKLSIDAIKAATDTNMHVIM